MKYLLTIAYLYRETARRHESATLIIPLLKGRVLADEIRMQGKTRSTYRRTVEIPEGAIAGPHTCDGTVHFILEPLE